jgi:ribosomal protein S18 acetylase RimI-like enzyme
MKLSLRPATPRDLEFLWSLHRETMRRYVDAIWGWVECDQRERFLKNFEPTDLQIIEVDGKAIGLWHVEWRSDHVFLVSVEVLTAYQNRGIGSKLIGDLLEKAEERGLAVRLQVLLGNPAENLYRRLGFCETGRSATHVQLARA